MNFNTLSWAAVLFYYRSAGDTQYGKIVSDVSFLERLRRRPESVDPEEFEKKVILDLVRVEDYNLLVGHALARRVLSGMVEHRSLLSPLLDMTILECNLSGTFTTDVINRVYSDIACVGGLWVTGGSKILHLLNESLFPMLSPEIASTFGLVDNEFRMVEWMRFVQDNAKAVDADFKELGLAGSPGSFLSERLGYASAGFSKTLVKFLDEYFWIKYGDGLPVPPEWVPESRDTDLTASTPPSQPAGKTM